MDNTRTSRRDTRCGCTMAIAAACSVAMLASIGSADAPTFDARETATNDAQRSYILQLAPPATTAKKINKTSVLTNPSDDQDEDEPDMQFASHDGYLFDNGPPDGVTGLSNVVGTLPSGYQLNRVVAADFWLEGDAILTRFEMSGVWFQGTGAATPIEGLRVRIWGADADGLPGETLHDFIAYLDACDDGLSCYIATETGAQYGGRPEVHYSVEPHPPLPRPWMPTLWLSIQPIGAGDNFFQLTSATGNENIIGEQAHVQWIDLGFPEWTPSNIAAGEYYDVTFAIFGLIDDEGACCLDDGECAIVHEAECLAVGGVYHGDGSDCELCDPGIDPYICEGYCGGMAPGGCWCDEYCDVLGDCCDDVCEQCPDTEFCDPGIDPYVCDGYCGEMAPGGCWCDDLCILNGDCCDDACEACPDEDLCDPGIDPYTCIGFCGEQAPGGCWCDALCDQFGDCCDDVCNECPTHTFCDPGIDPYTCAGLCGEQAPGGCWCDEFCCLVGDCCDDQADVCEFCDPGIDPYTCLGDLNDDGVVDGADLLQLLSEWGPCDGCPSDITGDGVVDGADLLQLLSNWGECEDDGGDDVIVGACCLWDGSCSFGPIADCPVFTIGVSFFIGVTCDEAQCPEQVSIPYDGGAHWIIIVDEGPSIVDWSIVSNPDNIAPIEVVPVGLDGNPHDAIKVAPGGSTFVSHEDVAGYLAMMPAIPGAVGMFQVANEESPDEQVSNPECGTQGHVVQSRTLRFGGTLRFKPRPSATVAVGNRERRVQTKCPVTVKTEIKDADGNVVETTERRLKQNTTTTFRHAIPVGGSYEISVDCAEREEELCLFTLKDLEIQEAEPLIRCHFGNAVHGVFQGVMTCDECEALFNNQGQHTHWWGTLNGVEICSGK